MQKTLGGEIRALRIALADAQSPLDLGLMARKVEPERLAEALGNVHAAIAALHALIPITERPPYVGRAERCRSLVEALTAIARERGAWLVAKEARDGLQNAIVKYAASPAAQEYWSGATQDQGIVGHLMNEPDVAEQLEQRGVLLWVADDEAVRIVDVRRLEAHSDIRAYVTGSEPSGLRCKFCGLRESDPVQELVELEAETRSALDRAPHLQPGTVHVHERCREHWEAWLRLAESYRSQEEAEAADKAAGRVPRSPVVESVSEPERFEAPRVARPAPAMRNRKEHGYED